MNLTICLCFEGKGGGDMCLNCAYDDGDGW